jgi:Flp pilus assembly protein TadG
VVLRRRADRGASAVEFALVFPLLLILVFGLIQYGLYFWALQGGSDLARSGARLAAVGDDSVMDCDDFESAVAGTTPGYASTTPTVQRTYANGESNTGADVEVGDVVTVTVQFNAIDLNFPFVPFIDDGSVSQQVEARVERVDSQPEQPCT